MKVDSPTLRQIWMQGGCIENAWITIGDPYFVEIVAASGAFTAITLDMQHGLMETSQVIDCARAIQANQLAVLVRLPQLDPALIGKLLDAACDGLILPQVASADQASRFVGACNFPPRGNRSFGPTRLGLVSTGSDRDFLTVAMIESQAGLDSVDEIARVDGLDGLFVGPGDLGIALGIGPGQDREEPRFLEALGHVQQAARHNGKCLGIHANSAGFAARQARQGFQLVTKWVDVVAIQNSIHQAANQWTREFSVNITDPGSFESPATPP